MLERINHSRILYLKKDLEIQAAYQTLKTPKPKLKIFKRQEANMNRIRAKKWCQMFFCNKLFSEHV